jgi:hypothetical protein
MDRHREKHRVNVLKPASIECDDTTRQHCRVIWAEENPDGAEFE